MMCDLRSRTRRLLAGLLAIAACATLQAGGALRDEFDEKLVYLEIGEAHLSPSTSGLGLLRGVGEGDAAGDDETVGHAVIFPDLDRTRT